MNRLEFDPYLDRWIDYICAKPIISFRYNGKLYYATCVTHTITGKHIPFQLGRTKI